MGLTKPVSLPDPLAGIAGRRRVVLESALAAFAERGYHGTTTREVSHAAGISAAGMYAYFGSKLELLYVLSLRGHEAAASALASGLSAGSDPQECIRSGVYQFAAWHAHHHRLARVAQHELGTLEPQHYREIVAIRSGIETSLASYVARAISLPLSSAPLRLSRAMLSLCIDVCRWYRDSSRESAADIGVYYGSLAETLIAHHPFPTSDENTV